MLGVFIFLVSATIVLAVTVAIAAFAILIAKSLARPILSLIVFLVQVFIGAMLSPIFLPILLYCYFFDKEKFHSLTNKTFKTTAEKEAEKEIKDLYGVSLEEIQKNPQKDYGDRHF